MKLKISHLANGANALLNADDDSLITLYPSNCGIYNNIDSDYFCITNQDSPSSSARKLGPSNVEATIINGVETPFSGTKDELINILSTSFFSSVGGGGTTNASGEQFKIEDGVFQIDLDWLSAFIAGGGTPLSKSVVTFGSSTTSQNVANWSNVPNATSYVLKRSVNSDMSNATTLYTGALLTFTDTGLTESTVYYYSVTASGSGYINSTSDIANKSTSGGSSAGAPAKMFAGSGSGAIAYDNVTLSSVGGSFSVMAGSGDTAPTSSLAITSLTVRRDASWNGKNVLFGLQTYNVGRDYDKIHLFIFLQSSQMKVGKTENANAQNITYSVTDGTYFRIEVVNGSVNKEVTFSVSEDGINFTPVQSDGGNVSTDLPNATLLYGNVALLDGGVTVREIKVA